MEIELQPTGELQSCKGLPGVAFTLHAACATRFRHVHTDKPLLALVVVPSAHIACPARKKTNYFWRLKSLFLYH